MFNNPLILLMVVVFLGYLVYHFFFTRTAIIKRRIRKAPRFSVQDFPEGEFGKIVGRLAYLGEPLTAPLTQRRCAQYRVVVEERRSSGRSSHWASIIEEEDGRDFIVKDETGEALVRMRGAQVAVTKDARFRSGTFSDTITPELESFLAEHGRESTGFLGFEKSLRYEEGVLEEGEEVAVCGVGRREEDPNARGSAEADAGKVHRLVLESSADTALYVTDDQWVVRR